MSGSGGDGYDRLHERLALEERAERQGLQLRQHGDGGSFGLFHLHTGKPVIMDYDRTGEGKNYPLGTLQQVHRYLEVIEE